LYVSSTNAEPDHHCWYRSFIAPRKTVVVLTATAAPDRTSGYIQIGLGGSRQSAAIGTDNRASGGKAAAMAIISDDLVTDLRSLRGTELERTVHDAIKVGIDDALTKNIAPVMVGYEAMAQGLAILTGVGLDQSRDALLNVIKDLGAQLSA
jgi:hypothetical protein